MSSVFSAWLRHTTQFLYVFPPAKRGAVFKVFNFPLVVVSAADLSFAVNSVPQVTKLL